jgi:hypothetical protein
MEASNLVRVTGDQLAYTIRRARPDGRKAR